MKKLIALLLVFAMVLPMCGCGKSKAVANVEGLISAIGEVSLDSGEAIASAHKAYDALTEDEKAKVKNHAVLLDAEKQAKYLYGKEAYENICIAWEVADQFGGDLYGTWVNAGAVEKEVRSKGVSYYNGKLTVSEAELLEGFAHTVYAATVGKFDYEDNGWSELSEGEKQKYRDEVAGFLEVATPFVVVAVHGIVFAYQANGERLETAKTALETAKSAMKKLNEQYSDYEHYPDLKGFYTTTNALLDYCSSPNGTLEQYIDLLKDYRKEAADYMNNLDFIFE